jgi:uncharacterized protein YcgL (UPF0745 family)
MYFLANVSFICDLVQALKSFCSIYKHFVEYFIYVEVSGELSCKPMNIACHFGAM